MGAPDHLHRREISAGLDHLDDQNGTINWANVFKQFETATDPRVQTAVRQILTGNPAGHIHDHPDHPEQNVRALVFYATSLATGRGLETFLGRNCAQRFNAAAPRPVLSHAVPTADNVNQTVFRFLNPSLTVAELNTAHAALMGQLITIEQAVSFYGIATPDPILMNLRRVLTSLLTNPTMTRYITLINASHQRLFTAMVAFNTAETAERTARTAGGGLPVPQRTSLPVYFGIREEYVASGEGEGGQHLNTSSAKDWARFVIGIRHQNRQRGAVMGLLASQNLHDHVLGKFPILKPLSGISHITENEVHEALKDVDPKDIALLVSHLASLSPADMQSRAGGITGQAFQELIVNELAAKMAEALIKNGADKVAEEIAGVERTMLLEPSQHYAHNPKQEIAHLEHLKAPHEGGFLDNAAKQIGSAIGTAVATAVGRKVVKTVETAAAKAAGKGAATAASEAAEAAIEAATHKKH